MRNEIKTAMIIVLVVVALVGGIGYYFTTLDKQKEMLNSASDSKKDLLVLIQRSFHR